MILCIIAIILFIEQKIDKRYNVDADKNAFGK